MRDEIARRTRRKDAQEFKEDAVRLILEGTPIAEVADKVGVKRERHEEHRQDGGQVTDHGGSGRVQVTSDEGSQRMALITKRRPKLRFAADSRSASGTSGSSAAESR